MYSNAFVVKTPLFSAREGTDDEFRIMCGLFYSRGMFLSMLPVIL